MALDALGLASQRGKFPALDWWPTPFTFLHPHFGEMRRVLTLLVVPQFALTFGNSVVTTESTAMPGSGFPPDYQPDVGFSDWLCPARHILAMAAFRKPTGIAASWPDPVEIAEKSGVIDPKRVLYRVNHLADRRAGGA